MFPHLKNFNLQQWIDDNRENWGQRRQVWQDSDFLVWVNRGPNSRTDFHIDPGDEIFYQLEGELNLHYLTPEGQEEVAVIKAGEMFLMPARVPHSPRRKAGSWSLIVERQRRPEELDQFIWFCERCHARLFETTARFDDPNNAVRQVYERMKADPKNRTCSECGHVAAEPA